MSDMWANLKNDTIWRWWPEGLLEGIFVKQSAINNAPLEDFLKYTLGEWPEGYKRYVALSSLNANTGEYKVFT